MTRWVVFHRPDEDYAFVPGTDEQVNQGDADKMMKLHR